MKKYHFILLLLLVIFFTSSNSYACGTCSENNVDKKELSSNKNKGNCCDTESHSKTKNHDGCGGKCGHSKCACPSASNCFTVSYELVVLSNSYNFTSEKEKFSTAETFISSGFYFLWLLPKIS